MTREATIEIFCMLAFASALVALLGLIGANAVAGNGFGATAILLPYGSFGVCAFLAAALVAKVSK